MRNTASPRAVFNGRYVIKNEMPSSGSIAHPSSEIEEERPENVLWLEDDVAVIPRVVVDRILLASPRARDSSY
jgi:hypothetical protein